MSVISHGVCVCVLFVYACFLGQIVYTLLKYRATRYQIYNTTMNEMHSCTTDKNPIGKTLKTRVRMLRFVIENGTFGLELDLDDFSMSVIERSTNIVGYRFWCTQFSFHFLPLKILISPSIRCETDFQDCFWLSTKETSHFKNEMHHFLPTTFWRFSRATENQFCPG